MEQQNYILGWILDMDSKASTEMAPLILWDFQPCCRYCLYVCSYNVRWLDSLESKIFFWSYYKYSDLLFQSGQL